MVLCRCDFPFYERRKKKRKSLPPPLPLLPPLPLVPGEGEGVEERGGGGGLLGSA